MRILRFLRHSCTFPWQVRRVFPKRSLSVIETLVRESECSHLAELKFVVEAALSPGELIRGMTARQRALEVFSQLRLWDTEHNSGVLIYLLLADRRVEIIADRGINAKTGSDVWESICRAMEAQFRTGNFEQGVLSAITQITVLLQRHFPAQGQLNANEIGDSPVLL
ncbi:MAG: hypothetical protein CTY34_03190 [Methylobacter sp.]|nr:MAG: hypothetical protein CTY34_03190 [Methylobacter sp.]PPD32449.1 MAG: hypothetical protein CTY18_09995 [Methylomonas sp.]